MGAQPSAGVEPRARGQGRLGAGADHSRPTARSRTRAPIWVTAASATTLNVDWDDDGTVDATVPITAFQSVRLFDTTDGDQTGARIFTTDGTFIAAAWGQDPSISSAGAPALDLGNTRASGRRTFRSSRTALSRAIGNGNGLLDPGDTLLYTLFVLNTGVVDADDVVVTDTPDPYTIVRPRYHDMIAGTPYPDDVRLRPRSRSTKRSEPRDADSRPGRHHHLRESGRQSAPSPTQQIINVAEVTYGTGVVVTSTNVAAVTPPQFTVTKTSESSRARRFRARRCSTRLPSRTRRH